jgi:hypothetical protein
MRITIDIDEDVLVAAKELAQREGSTTGRVLSRLARFALTGGNTHESEPAPAVSASVSVYGFRPFAKNCFTVTNDAINQLRDQEGI